MDVKRILFELSHVAGVTGVSYAADISEIALARYGPTRRDAMGGVYALLDYGKEKTILLDAHLDEIGLMATGIDEDGFVHVSKSGGVDLRTLLGQEVVVHTRSGPLYGIFCCPVPHLSHDEKTMPPLEDMAIDMGFKKEETEKRVFPGDRISFFQSPAELLCGRVTGKSMDNRAGVAALLRTADLLQGHKCSVNVILALSAQEEIGCRGAKTLAYELFPDEALVVDVSFGDSAGVPENRCGKLDGGVMIGVSPTLTAHISNSLCSLAQKHGIPYQIEGMGGTTSTNADVISLTKTGVPCGLLSIPLRYMHTAVETLSVADIECTAQLLSRYLVEWGDKAC